MRGSRAIPERSRPRICPTGAPLAGGLPPPDGSATPRPGLAARLSTHTANRRKCIWRRHAPPHRTKGRPSRESPRIPRRICRLRDPPPSGRAGAEPFPPLNMQHLKDTRDRGKTPCQAKTGLPQQVKQISLHLQSEYRTSPTVSPQTLH